MIRFDAMMYDDEHEENSYVTNETNFYCMMRFDAFKSAGSHNLLRFDAIRCDLCT
jgi:hypothetical protein